MSVRAHLILPYHKAIEKANEQSKGSRRIGTTGRGIGPSYADKMSRIGIRVDDLLNPTCFAESLKRTWSKSIGFWTPLSCRENRAGESVPTVYELCRSAEGHISDTSVLLSKAIKRGHNSCLKVRRGRIWMSISARIRMSPHRVLQPAARAPAQELAPPLFMR